VTAAHLEFREGAEYDLSPDLEAVEVMLRQMKRYLDERGFPDQEWPNLQLAVAEVLNNAIIHGCHDQPEARLRFRWAWNDHGLTVQVRDPGHFEPPANWHELPEDPLAESGRGGFLIRSFFDQVQHDNSERGHEVTLHKAISVAPQPPNVATVEAELHLMTQDLSDSYESLAAMFNLSALLATSQSFNEFMSSALSRLRNLLSTDLVYARLRRADGKWQLFVDRANEGIPKPLASPSAQEDAVLNAQQFISNDRASRLPASDPLRQWQAGLMIGPVSFQGKAIGLIVAGRREGAPFTAGQTSLLRTIADFVGVAHTTAELHRQREEQMRERRELEIAAQIQRSLLPTAFPASPHWEIHGVCESARAVGGDFFDAMAGPDGHILVLIADVMGKGMPAAMLSSLLRASARARLDLAHDPARLLTELNRLLAGDLETLSMFITAELISLSPDGTHCTIANAGHAGPLVFLAEDSAAREIPTRGDVPLGVLPDTQYQNTKTAITPGAVVCLVTDGLFELEDASGEMLGLKSLCERLPNWWQGNLSEFTSTCITSLKLIQRDHQSDDRTLVAITRKPLTP
jgi:serine phosphatase RsbU (regulator of sigma subunit)/anti-sigma regulatory factor (Ser/Thr protein kinase)